MPTTKSQNKSQVEGKKDHKQILLDLIAQQQGPHNAVLVEDALGLQKKQLEEAMLQGGITMEQALAIKGIDLSSLVSKDVTPPESKPTPQKKGNFWYTPFQMNQQTGKVTPASILGGLISQNPKDVLAMAHANILGRQSQNQNLTPEQLANTIQSYNQTLPEGYQASYGAGGKIMASKPSSYATATTPKEIEGTADGIISGDLPPDLTKVSSYRDRTKVSSALQAKGYDLKKANLDWTAANKFYTSMNSTQQVRLRQAINSVQGALGNLENLNQEYKRSGFTPLNKAQLIANSKGVGQQADLAAGYLTSLGVIQDELSQVFMGGNSPTEKFLQQAQNILKGDYTFSQLSEVTKQLRINLQYRLNSINQAETYSPSNKTAEEKVSKPKSITEMSDEELRRIAGEK